MEGKGGKAKAKGKEWERKGSDKDKEGRTGRRGQREGMEEEWRGNERRKGEREEFFCSCDFSLEILWYGIVLYTMVTP